MKKLLAILLCMTLVLSFVACSSNGSSKNETEITEEKVMTISEAIDSVDGLSNIGYKPGITGYRYYFSAVEDDYATLEIDTDTDGWDTDTTDKLDQLHSKLGFSGALLSKIENTRGLDGIQIEENDNYKVTWSYSNPDLNITYEMK